MSTSLQRTGTVRAPRRAAVAGALVALAAGAVPAIAAGPAASAGTVHVLSADDVPGNVPHLATCALRVQLSGFPTGEHAAAVTVTGVLSDPVVPLALDPPGPFLFSAVGSAQSLDMDRVVEVDTTGVPLQAQGAHVRVEVAVGETTKTKTIWLAGCDGGDGDGGGDGGDSGAGSDGGGADDGDGSRDGGSDGDATGGGTTGGEPGDGTGGGPGDGTGGGPGDGTGGDPGDGTGGGEPGDGTGGGEPGDGTGGGGPGDGTGGAEPPGGDPQLVDGTGDDPAPDVALTLDGPDEGRPGTTAEWEVAVANVGQAPARGFSLVPSLPDGVDVRDVAHGSDWSCLVGVLCTYGGEVPPGAALPPLTLTVGYAADAVGTRVLGMAASPAAGEPEAALENNTGWDRTRLLDELPVPVDAPIDLARADATPSTPVTTTLLMPRVLSPFVDTTSATPAQRAAALPRTGAPPGVPLVAGAVLLPLGAALTALGRRRTVPA